MKVEAVNLEGLKALHEAGKLYGAFLTSSDDYHNAPGISSSMISKAIQSLESYKYARENPEPPSQAMEFGSVLHVLVNEPELFTARYAVTDIERRGTKAWDAFVEANPGKTIIKLPDFEKAKAMADKARQHPRASLLDGMKEISFFWKDAQTGLLCKCRPDNLTQKGVIVDYKSCEEAFPERVWSRHLFNYGYHIQAPFYLDGVNQALIQSGQSDRFPKLEAFVHYAQEKSPPFLVKPWLVGDATLELGRRVIRTTLDQILQAEKTNFWPGYPEKIAPIEAPEWAWEQEVANG